MRTSFSRTPALAVPVAIVVAYVLGAPAVLAAQVVPRPRASDEAVPRELALALLDLGPGIGGNTDIRVGEAPIEVPPELIPKGAVILGSMVRFDNSVIVLAMPQTPDSAIGVLESQLLTSGWTRPEMPQNRQRGFVGGGPAGQWEPPNVLCHDSAFVNLSSTYRRSGGSIVKVGYNRAARYSLCHQTQREFRSPWDESPMPILRAPPDARTVGGGSSSSAVSLGGSPAFGVSTRLATALKPGDVLAHYDRQMRDQGWTPLADGATDMLAARFYRKKDDRGASWTASLTSILTPGSSEQDVALRLEKR